MRFILHSHNVGSFCRIASARDRKSQAGRKRPGRSRPFLECLEDRTLPAGFTIMWTNPMSGDWDTAGNWLDNMGHNRVPNGNDDALINVAGVTVSHDQSTPDAVHSLVSFDPMTLSAGSIAFGSASQINASLDLSGGTIAGAKGSVGVQSLTWEAGTISIANLTVGGTSSLSGTGTKFLDTGTLTTPGGATLTGTGGLTFLNNSTWDDSAGGTLDNQSTLAGDGTFQGTFTNDGIVHPGQSPGRIKILGHYTGAAASRPIPATTLGANGILQIGIGGNTAGTGYSQLEVNGSLSLAGTLQVSQLNDFVPELNDTFLIVQNDTAGLVMGTFSMLPAGSQIMVAGKNEFNQPITTTYRIDYNGGQFSNSVILTDLTPPTTVSSDNSQVEVSLGTKATNTGKWGDGRAADTVTLKASIGTIVQSGDNSSGTWSWSYPTAGKSPGSQTVTITADDGHGGISTSTFMLTIDKAPTTSAVKADVNPSVFGQPVNFTASVRQGGTPTGVGLPTGTVTFMDGASTLGTATLDATAHATYSTAALARANHAITAVYSGDTNYAGETSVAYGEKVNRASTTITLNNVTTGSTVFGQDYTVMWSVSAVSPGAGTPTGTVTFMDGATPLFTLTLNNAGQNTVATKRLSVGAHTSLTAVYNGSGSFVGNTSSPVSHTVNMASTTTAVKADVNPSVVGHPVTFTASVRPTPPGSGTPTGMVTFKDGAQVLGKSTVDATAHATLSTTSLAVGNHVITAVYSGDGSFNGSTSGVYGQKVTSSVMNVFAAPGGANPPGVVSAFSSAVSLTNNHVSAPASSGSAPTSTQPSTAKVLAVTSSVEARVDAFFAESRNSVRLILSSGKHSRGIMDDDGLGGSET
jgi:Bacterial Ig-like domain (group 3)